MKPQSPLQTPIPAGLTTIPSRFLLRKVGRSYIFIHRMLLEYFASLENNQNPKAPVETSI